MDLRIIPVGLETLLATCGISDFQFKFSSVITPKKTVLSPDQFFGHLLKVE